MGAVSELDAYRVHQISSTIVLYLLFEFWKILSVREYSTAILKMAKKMDILRKNRKQPT